MPSLGPSLLSIHRLLLAGGGRNSLQSVLVSLLPSSKPMAVLFFLLALYLTAFWYHVNLVLAQTPTSTIIKANDRSVSWSPPVQSLQDGKPCKLEHPCEGWFQLDVFGHTYIVASVSSGSKARVSLKFQGSAIDVYGGAFNVRNTTGVGLASIDGRPLQNRTFPVVTGSTDVASFGGLDPYATHSLAFAFTDSPETLVGFEYFKIQHPEATPSDATSSHTQSTTSQRPLSEPTKQYPIPTAASQTDQGISSGKPNSIGGPPASAVTIVVNGTPIITSYPSPRAGRSNISGHPGLKAWQFALLVLGPITLFILCFFALRYWRRARTRAPSLVLDNDPPVEVKSVSGTVALDDREATPSTVPDYAFTRPGSSVSTSRDLQWRNSRIGVSPYLYQRPVPYPESTTNQSSYIDAVSIPVRRSMLAPPPLPGATVVRQITFSTKGRVLKVQNPDFRSNASTTETETPHDAAD